MALQKQTSDIVLSPAQQDYVSFTACGGLIPTEDGFGRPMTAASFAQHWGIARQTLYDWRRTIPDFWKRVNERRTEIGGNDRVSAVWNGVYLRAVKGDAEQAKLFLANFDPNFIMPTNQVKVEKGDSWGDLLAAHVEAEEEEKPEIIEGEVVQVSLVDQLIAARAKAEENAVNRTE